MTRDNLFELEKLAERFMGKVKSEVKGDVYLQELAYVTQRYVFPLRVLNDPLNGVPALRVHTRGGRRES